MNDIQDFLGWASPFLVLWGLLTIVYYVGWEEMKDKKKDE